MPFGRHRGQTIPDLPDDYLAWLRDFLTLREPLRSAVEHEYHLRLGEVWPSMHPDAFDLDDLEPDRREAAAVGALEVFRERLPRYHDSAEEWW